MKIYSSEAITLNYFIFIGYFMLFMVTLLKKKIINITDNQFLIIFHIH